MRTIYRVSWLVTIGWLLLFTMGCTTAWTTEASGIIQMLVPAISMALNILSAFGVGLSTNTLTAVNSWAADATASLATVGALIDQYNAADPSAQPGILTEIQNGLSVVIGNLSALLPEIHITNIKVQSQILAVFEAIQAEMGSLVNLIPALQGKVSHEEFKALIAKVKSGAEFKKDFNVKSAVFGKEYTI